MPEIDPPRPLSATKNGRSTYQVNRRAAPALGLTRLPAGYWWALAAILAGYLTLTLLVNTWAIRHFALD